MLVSGIRSRPVYPGFVIDSTAQRHVFALEGEGALALLELVQPGDPMLALAEIVYFPDGVAQRSHSDALAALGARAYRETATAAEVIAWLYGVLATAKMGLRLYVAGTEPFIGAVVCVGAEHGIKHQSITKEHRGSLRRRVQCVHCKGFTDDVTTSPVPCARCGLSLLVRDHFSRRHNAFQGVCVNAEDPTVRVEPVELFP